MISKFTLNAVVVAITLGTFPANAQEAGEWVNLLENDSLKQWQRSASKVPTKKVSIGEAWSVKDGVLHLDRDNLGKNGKKKRGRSIVTKKDYFNFEFKFEFQIAFDGDSGVKYRVTDSTLGPEYQIIDDVNFRESRKPTHRTAGLYHLVAPDEAKKNLKLAGEGWNSGRIVAHGNRLEHWVNGKQVVKIVIDSEDWNERLANSIFKQRANFARKGGPILLQDHFDTVSFRKLMVRELPEPEEEEKAEEKAEEEAEEEEEKSKEE